MKNMMIIGGTGSLGESLINRLVNVYNITVISRDENKQWAMKKKYPDVNFSLCDIRDKERFETVLLMHKPVVIILASALKHIDICENNIDDCISTNIIGVQNVLGVITNNSLKSHLPFLEKVIFISTDKASSPVNVYGMCKSICERMVVDKSKFILSPRFVCVRYGNVLTSRGSIIPLFKGIGSDANYNCFPVTHPEMTRFFMRLDDSINLILKAMEIGESGDTFIPKIKSFKILDIAEYFSQLYDKPVQIVGVRPGEKIHECLINESESHRTLDKGDYFVIKPCYKNITSNDLTHEYTSAMSISSQEEVKSLIDLL